MHKDYGISVKIQQGDGRGGIDPEVGGFSP